jgi:hypothetical protein
VYFHVLIYRMGGLLCVVDLLAFDTSLLVVVDVKSVVVFVF